MFFNIAKPNNRVHGSEDPRRRTATWSGPTFRLACASLHFGRSARGPVGCEEKRMNEKGKMCPSCKSDIGIRPLWPDGRLKCPHCRVKLQYNPLGVGFFSFLLFLYCGIVTLACFLTTGLLARMSTHAYMMFWIVVGLVIWLPFGFFSAYHLRRNSTLELK